MVLVNRIFWMCLAHPPPEELSVTTLRRPRPLQPCGICLDAEYTSQVCLSADPAAQLVPLREKWEYASCTEFLHFLTKYRVALFSVNNATFWLIPLSSCNNIINVRTNLLQFNCPCHWAVTRPNSANPQFCSSWFWAVLLVLIAWITSFTAMEAHYMPIAGLNSLFPLISTRFYAQPETWRS